MYEPQHTDRRTLLGAAGAGLVVAVAGCLGSDDTSDDGTANDTGTNDGDTGDESGATTLDEPVSVPEGEECAVCGMIPAQFPEWNAQLVHEDETRTHLCSSGCLLAYTVDPGRFDGPDSDIANEWVTGYETGDLVDARTASFVRVTDPDHVDDIMTMNPTPFADREDAVSFVESFDAYSEDDIITAEAFDRDLAELYRSQFFGDGGSGHDGGDA